MIKKILNIYNIFILVLFIILINLPSIVNAETIIYDNFTTSNYKLIKLDDSLNNIPLIGNYKYEVYVNSQFLGYYTRDDNIFVPDNSSIMIYIPSTIKTDTSNIWIDYLKPMIFNVIGFALTNGLWLIVVLLLIYKVILKR